MKDKNVIELPSKDHVQVLHDLKSDTAVVVNRDVLDKKMRDLNHKKLPQPGNKKSHKIRNLFLAGAGITGALAWNNNRLWSNVPPLESKLPGVSNFFNSRNGKIFYKEAGSNTNPPVVFIHGIGAGANSYTWHYNFDTLAQDYHVYAYDLLGFGNSDMPNINYSAELYIALLTEFLENVVKVPAIIVASSLSAGHAIQVAYRRPELIERMVLIEPSGIDYLRQRTGPNVTGKLSYPILNLPVLGKAIFSWVASRNNIRSFMKSQMFVDKHFVTDEMVEQYYRAAHRDDAEHAPLAFFASRLNAEIFATIGKLKQPLLMIWGMNSTITPVKEGYRLMEENRTARMIVLEDASLACNEEKAAQFNEAVANFLKDRRVAPRGSAIGAENF